MPDDPIHEHLYELISMLPGPDDVAFWTEVANINDVGAEYVSEKMSTAALYINAPIAADDEPGTNIGYFCEYAIMFFGGSKPKLWDLISLAVFSTAGEDSDIGRVFANDLVNTAWRLIVRYGGYTDASRVRRWAGGLRYPT